MANRTIRNKVQGIGLARSGQGRAIREAAGLSLADLAREVGVAPSTIWRWENGLRTPKGDRASANGELLMEIVTHA